jgi:alpha-galactosidase
MALEEYRAHFSLWCVLAAPLLAGNDLRNMTDEVRQILTAPEVIAVDQDPLGRQGDLLRADGTSEVWARELADGSRAVVLFERGEEPQEIGVTWAELGWPASATVTVRDLWERSDLAVSKEGCTAAVPPHGARMLRLTPKQS